jgi:hypothetical protein
MSNSRQSKVLSPDLEFAYRQFFVYDAALTSPACEWTTTHSKQGFARRDRAVAVGTLLEFGTAAVSVERTSPASVDAYERVIAVPLHVLSNSVAIDGPEETAGIRCIDVPQGHYRVTVAQRVVNDVREEIGVWLERLDVPMQRSEILIVDADLEPPTSLLETANEP